VRSMSFMVGDFVWLPHYSVWVGGRTAGIATLLIVHGAPGLGVRAEVTGLVGGA
jgi:hypothetical protein